MHGADWPNGVGNGVFAFGKFDGNGWNNGSFRVFLLLR
jgi:hypothetical protein